MLALITVASPPAALATSALTVALVSRPAMAWPESGLSTTAPSTLAKLVEQHRLHLDVVLEREVEVRRRLALVGLMVSPRRQDRRGRLRAHSSSQAVEAALARPPAPPPALLGQLRGPA